MAAYIKKSGTKVGNYYKYVFKLMKKKKKKKEVGDFEP